MKISIFVMCMFYLLPVQPEDIDRYAYCESCLTVAQEIEEALKETPAESRQAVIEHLISGGVCDKLLSYKHGQSSKDKMTSYCIHLLDSHYDNFHAALVNKEPKHFGVVLCYEQSTACVGVKRQSFEGSKTTFTESDIDALLWKNKENVRIAKPIHSGSPVHSKDEL
ncbi:hypothetical protein PFLUV_G00176590 [Scomber scombrus]|uniref:Saposin B-type domain-containing protein n=1 Tax=Scomber scombrus TaxID=13677 RepID=A0AAV1NYV4_SCOSC